MPKETFSMKPVIKVIHDLLDLNDADPTSSIDKFLDAVESLPIEGLSEEYEKLVRRLLVCALIQSIPGTRAVVEAVTRIIEREHHYRQLRASLKEPGNAEN